VSNHQSSPQATTVPAVRDIEARFVKMRNQLEGMARQLQIAEDEVLVAADAASGQGYPDLSTVLKLSIADRLFGPAQVTQKHH
jgi:hypothetical protein